MKRKAIIVILIVILLLVYPIWRVYNAKMRINHFSQQISVGTPIDTVESLSRKLNLNFIRSAGDDSERMTLVVWDGWAFARWTCSVSFEKNNVVGKKVLFLD
jgi:hypothetical protein